MCNNVSIWYPSPSLSLYLCKNVCVDGVVPIPRVVSSVCVYVCIICVCVCSHFIHTITHSIVGSACLPVNTTNYQCQPLYSISVGACVCFSLSLLCVCVFVCLCVCVFVRVCVVTAYSVIYVIYLIKEETPLCHLDIMSSRCSERWICVSLPLYLCPLTFSLRHRWVLRRQSVCMWIWFLL